MSDLLPAASHFPLALALARRGYRIRRRAWGPVAWLEWSGGQLRVAGSANILPASHLAEADLRATDWTVFDTNSPSEACLAIPSPVSLAAYCPYPGPGTTTGTPPLGTCEDLAWTLPQSCAGLTLTAQGDCRPEAPGWISFRARLYHPNPASPGATQYWEVDPYNVEAGFWVLPGEMFTAPALNHVGTWKGETITFSGSGGTLYEVVDGGGFAVGGTGVDLRLRPAWTADYNGVLWSPHPTQPWVTFQRQSFGSRRYFGAVVLPTPLGASDDPVRVTVAANWGTGERIVHRGWAFPGLPANTVPGSGMASWQCYLPGTGPVTFRAWAHPVPSTGPAWKSDPVTVPVPAPCAPAASGSMPWDFGS